MTKNFDYSAYAGLGHNRPDLAEIAKLANQQHEIEIKIENLEEQVKLAKEELREVAEKKLPEAMDALGISNFETDEGLVVAVKETIRATLSAENRPKGHAWLEANGFGGIIKSTVVAAFKRNEIEEAKKLVDRLQEEGRAASLERKVEAMTLMALVKEQLSQGKDIPMDIFSVFRQRISKVEV